MLVLPALLAFGLSPAAQAFVLDFEGFAAGTIIDNEYAASPPPGTNIMTVNLSSGPNASVIFDTNNPTGGDPDLAAPFTSSNPSLSDDYRPGNVLIIQERNNCDAFSCEIPDDEGSRPAGEIEFIFASPVTLLSIDFFDIEFNEDNNDPDSEILLFDDNDNPIATFFVPNTGGNNTWDQLSFGAVQGVKRLVIELNGSGAIDNVTYVPVPAAAWLFGSALGLLGWIRRRRS